MWVRVSFYGDLNVRAASLCSSGSFSTLGLYVQSKISFFFSASLSLCSSIPLSLLPSLLSIIIYLFYLTEWFILKQTGKKYWKPLVNLCEIFLRFLLLGLLCMVFVLPPRAWPLPSPLLLSSLSSSPVCSSPFPFLPLPLSLTP